jgi:flagellar motor switch/type III secretory pathway protein FliN
VPQILSEALGTSDLVAVHFPAKSAEGRDAGDVLVVLGGRLVHELAGRPGRGLRQTPAGRLPATGSGESDSPKSARHGSTPRSAKDLIARARSLKVRASADVARRSMTLGELAGLVPGSVIDLGKKVTDPLELRIYGAARRGHLVASGDAVTLPRGFGFRVRYLGVK